MESETASIVICGDWNLVQNYKLDTIGYLHENNKTAQTMVGHVKSLEKENEGIKKITWFSTKAPRKMARLDFLLVTPDIQSKVTNSGMCPGYRTDHSLIYLSLENTNLICGKGYWK